MNKASLAARYRPQTFAQVVGQDMVKAILSRAAGEDRIAPAYLLSGTRGVGKTTVARIFAKALNCANAPAPEPCNVCEPCRRITQGGFVDVVEIDGASNRGIDDVRRLRDAVGYAPLEGRYKVFIIDEAHMLTKEAFNALLKTLEEPPPRVTFILATTEQHKFPVTIVSRCQHFVFRQISETVLEAHVVSVLSREGIAFEPEAARLVARRAAGSVRDAMSLLGQALALGDETLGAAQTRNVLGLAGWEVMDRLLTALADQNVPDVTILVRELFVQCVDMGFFLRELGSVWRNLFFMNQTGSERLTSADSGLPEAERERLAAHAARFSLTRIHASWQMTLEAQRRILTSLDPSAGLELLLLNLALLPRLLPLGDIDPGAFASGLTDKTEPLAAVSTPATTDEAGHAGQVAAPDMLADPTGKNSSCDLSWAGFLDFCRDRKEFPPPIASQFTGEVQDDCLLLRARSQSMSEQVQRPDQCRAMEKLAGEWAGRPMTLTFLPPAQPSRTEAEMRTAMREHPVVQSLEGLLDASLIRCSLNPNKEIP